MLGCNYFEENAMARFVDRKDELATLNRLASDTRPHFLIVPYGHNNVRATSARENDTSVGVCRP